MQQNVNLDFQHEFCEIVRISVRTKSDTQDEGFSEMVNGIQSLTIFAKSSKVDVGLGSECGSVIDSTVSSDLLSFLLGRSQSKTGRRF